MPALKTTYTLLSGIILCAVVGLVVMAASYNRAFTDTSSAVHHTLVVLDETQQALSAVLEVDEGKPPDEIGKYVRILQQSTVDNKVQQARIDTLTRLIAAFSHRPAPERSDKSVRSAYTNSLRAIFLGMQREENRLLAVREQANAKSRDMLKSAIFVLLIVIFTLLCVSLLLILYNFRRRQLAEKGLLESEQRFSLLVQHVKDYAIFMIDPAGKVMTWNRGAEQIKGYKASEVIGQPISLFYTDEEIDRQEPQENLKKAAELGSFESVGLRRRKDGSVFYADVVFTCMRNEKGEITGYIKITKDITEQMKAEEEMKQALRREKDLNEMKSRFVTLASHEFKTPLSVILSSTSLIEKYSAPEMEDKRMRHVHRIKSNVKNLRQILSDFLSLEKLEEGVIKNNPTPTDLHQLAEEAILDMEESCKPGQTIALEVNGDPRMVNVDDHLLRNILNNLISNAVKYSPESAPIRCILQFQPETVNFMVVDTGIGIPAEEQEHLFERFFRAANTSGISGTGLGLSIVRRYLDLMDGRIEVSSEPGKGSIFTIMLPAVAEPGYALTSQRDSHQRH
ncbi:ATP-binding protein [Flavitalea sp. BT771]|uniref:ATP-binding protein n=1 Tax=Flavitalea sp. BT771 TaxID=3063329 RepID=UPI0026E2552F|nr:ATP-binding protein [Flavitalea sp. BT771]MDO6429516.1 ATP-binding protein [Flavitalea sp. BT771]MDV6218356.1 ATP-binding protein [Flavitalea sp. BT771]